MIWLYEFDLKFWKTNKAKEASTNMSSNKDSEHFLTMDNLSPAVKNVQYAVRGKVVIRAGEIEKDLKNVL